MHKAIDKPDKHSIFTTLGSHTKRGKRFLNEAKEALESWNQHFNSEAILNEKLQALVGAVDSHVDECLSSFDEAFSSLTPAHLENMSEKVREDIFLRVDAALKTLVASALEVWCSPGVAKFEDFKVEPLQALEKRLTEMSIYKFRPDAFQKHMRALEYCNRWSTSEHCRSIIVDQQMPEMTSTEMQSIMALADTGPVKSMSSAASSVLAQVFELNLRGKVSTELKGQMDKPIQDMAKCVRAHALLADCVLKGETPKELSTLDSEEAWKHLDTTAQSLGDRSFEEALGLLHKWMAVVAATAETMIESNSENNSEKIIEVLKKLCAGLESFDFLSGLDMQYVMGTDTSFHSLLVALEMSSQDMFICCAL